MITVRQVSSKKDIKKFIELPLELYRNCPQFTPPLYSDEKKLLTTGGDRKISESVFFLAEKDGKVVGRIQGIIQKQYNELHGERHARFTRFDSIDDTEVSQALFGAVEDWARNHEMTSLHGPLGYNDLDREGLLIEGFGEDSTFEEQYNFDYYPALVEDSGFQKEIDWLEFELREPPVRNDMLFRVSDRILSMNKLHIAKTDGISKKQYIDQYKDGFFECLDECYSKLYGTVPISKEAQDELVSQFMLIVKKEFLIFICDENERVVAFGLCFPSIAEAVKKSGGKMTLPTLIRILRAVNKPEIMDLALIAVRPEYQNVGINAVMITGILHLLETKMANKCETNLNLETNVQVISQWKHFDKRQHKRRRSYVKNIEKGE